MWVIFLQKVDSIAQQAIAEHATPGCQILAAKNGQVFYHKAFGNYTYDMIKPVDLNTIYDIASISKISATLFAAMQLYDLRKYSPEQPLSDILPIAKNTNKGNLIIKDILLHQAGLKPFIPFYEKNIKDGQLDPKIYNKIKTIIKKPEWFKTIKPTSVGFFIVINLTKHNLIYIP